MDNNKIMSKEKLGFYQIFQGALKVVGRNPKFLLLTFFASLSLFSFRVACDFASHSTLIDGFEFLIDYMKPRDHFSMIVSAGQHVTSLFRLSYKEPSLGETLRDFLQKCLISILFFIGPVHLLDLLNTIVIVYSASAIYGEKNSSSLKEMVFEPIRKVGLKGPLFTSLYALLLASLTVLGLMTLAINCYVLSGGTFHTSSILFLPLFLVLLVKYLEWSSIWNMGMVISILEEKHGYIALGVSAYISRGSRKRGFFLMLVFFVLRAGLRLSYLLMGWNGRAFSVASIGVYLGVSSMANVIMWVVFVVYFYDCKKRFLEKKIDVEEGKSAAEDVHH